MRIGVTKLSFEYSTFTLAIEPCRVQVMFRVEPMAHASPPTGAVSVREPLTVKAAESADTVASVGCFTLSLTALASVPARVHAELPPVGALATAVATTAGVGKSPFLEFWRCTVGTA